MVGAFWGPMLFELPAPERTLQQNRFKRRYSGYASKVGKTACSWGIHESYEREIRRYFDKAPSLLGVDAAPPSGNLPPREERYIVAPVPRRVRIDLICRNLAG